MERDLGGGYRSMGLCRRHALVGVLLASMAEGSAKIDALITPEDGIVEEGSDGFYSVRMRCMLRAWLVLPANRRATW